MYSYKDINAFHNWINKLFTEKKKFPRTLFEARKVAGSATYKQIKTVWNLSFKISFSYSVYYAMKTKRICCTFQWKQSNLLKSFAKKNNWQFYLIIYQIVIH